MKGISELIATPTAQLGKASRFIVFQIKLWSYCVRLLKQNRSTQQAAALSYRTIFGIVPLAIVVLLIFQSFPAYKDVGDGVKQGVYKQLHLTTIEYPDPANPGKMVMLTEYFDNIVAGFFAGLNKGSITMISAIIVIWAALGLLTTIEKAFNNIWHVSRGRSFLQRIINYWAILTLGPLLLGAGIFITTRSAMLGQIHRTVMSHIGPAVLSYLIATAAFFVLYFLMPNTRVKARAAIWGAAVGGLAWTLAKWGFGKYVTGFIPYNKIYGILGLVPLGVLWIYVTWLIVLFGLQLTFTTQNFKSLDDAEIAASRRRDDYFIANDMTVINIVREIAAAFQNNQAPVSQELICNRLAIPAEFGEKILHHLVSCGFIALVSEPRVGFVLLKDPRNIKLSDIADAVAAVSFGRQTPEQSHKLARISQTQRRLLTQYSLDEIIGVGPEPEEPPKEV
jgi:membrane protein